MGFFVSDLRKQHVLKRSFSYQIYDEAMASCQTTIIIYSSIQYGYRQNKAFWEDNIFQKRQRNTLVLSLIFNQSKGEATAVKF